MGSDQLEPLKVGFPDQSKFNRVRDALWKRSPSATIMVGAGFSKNAEIVKSGTSSAPSWTELTEAMCERLYPLVGDGYRESAIAASAEKSGALRYAQEYETAFGRTDLHSFLRTNVRDDHMRPGEMHRRLLRLPWRDVFSTNWDTLLERTCSDIPERSYSILRNTDEIPLAASPRIIKLHGSLDGHFPLIFTEEDYRTYPGRFAPFVNTVQQSMMESVFCLLGFSGDDPNFLHWSGWVRDNLQVSAPKIYLAGWLELSEHRRGMLEARNVIPIDLARHPQAKGWPKALRHQRATEWILRSLEGGRPYELADWPSPPRGPTSPTPDFLEPVQRVVPREPRAESKPSPSEAQSADDRATAVRMLLDVWSHNRRETYPGWLAAPSAVRSKMWSTNETAHAILGALPELTTIERLNAIREIMWRRQIQLEPLSLVEATSAKLEQEAQEVLNCIDCVNQKVDGEELREADWPMLREAWIEVGLDLVWASRLRFDEEEFNARVAAIVTFQDENYEVRHRICHERSLWAIFSLDYASLDELLNDWDVKTADPIWMMRKAALLFEIGKDKEAERLNSSALERTRQSSGDDEDVSMLSMESWALYCAGATLSHEEFWYASIEWRHRWDQLTPLKCNAPLEMRHYAEAIKGEGKPGRGKPFDLGNVWREGFSFSNSEYRRWVASHRAVRLPEIVGLPPTVRGRIVAGEILELAAQQLVPHEAELSARIVLRAARHEANGTLNVVLSRTNIAVMPVTSVGRLARTCISAIEYILPRIGAAYTPRYWPERLAVLMEALSRFLLRLEASDVGEIFNKAIGWYGDNLVSRDILLADPMRNLLSRSWESLAIGLRREKIMEVLGAPLVDLDGFSAGMAGAYRYPDPCVVLDKHPRLEVERTPETENQWREVVGLLVRGLRTEGEARKRAVIRLSRFVELKVATEPELAELAQALWEEGGRIPDGLPAGAEVFDWVFMVLPEPTPGLADERFRAKWLDPEAIDGVNAQPTDRILWEVGGAIDNLEALGVRFSLSEEERGHLAEVVRRWVLEPIPVPLQLSGEASPMFADHAGEDVRKAIAGLQYLLLEVEISVQCGDALLEKSQKLNLTQVPARALSVGLMRVLPERSEDVLHALRTGLASDDPKTAQDAVVALQFWLEASSRDDQLVPAPIDLFQEVGVIIFTRRKAALVQALRVAKWIMDKGNVEQRNVLGSLVVQGLGYLFEELRYETARDKDLDVPVLRWGCTNLAVSMAQGDWAEEIAIVRWVENATDDPLPEIRSIGGNLR